MAWLYIIYYKKLNKYYVGACKDLDRRLYEHNIGHSKFTSTGLPWELVYKEEFQDLITAKRRKTEIKSQEVKSFY